MANLGVNFKDLRNAVDWSIRQFATPRQNRLNAIQQYVGAHYAERGSEKRVPVNFLELAVTIYARQLAARAPRVLVTTGSRALRPFAKSAEIALNQVPDEIELGATLRRAVIEALFSVGVVKVGLCSSGMDILGHDYGEPYVDNVPLDDYFMDMAAKSRGGMQFEGNDYWIPVEAARAMYSGKASNIEPDAHTVTGDQGEQRADGITADEGAELYKEKVWLRDVYLIGSGKLVTYGVKTFEIFNIVNWDGPERGPYRTLGFSDVPGNLLPLPPVALWRDLHELGNTLFRKLGKQADSKKTVATFGGGNDDAVMALKNAKDGEGIRYNGQKPENITVGGIDAPTLGMFLQCRDLFSYFAGNLDTLGGLAPATDTVGQDKLLSVAANARLDFMRDETIKFTQGIFKSLAWYEWTDPVRERTIEKPVKGTDIFIRRSWSEETREGDFLDYNFKIDVYSMRDDSPETKLQKIGQALERYVIPMLPLVQQQGGQLDLEALIKLIAELGNLPELNDLVTFGALVEGQPVQAGGESTPSTMPANTTRTYERVNRPGATRQGKDHVMSQLLFGGNAQASEVAALARPLG